MGISTELDSSVYLSVVNRLKSGQNLLAVSKLQPIEKIQWLYNQGQRHFGENYIQEALQKIAFLPNLSIQWHLIGPLQKNKVKYLKKHFAYIHSIDSLELARKISEHALTIQHRQKVFLQVNLAKENSKSGFSKQDFLEIFPEIQALPGLQVIGLMTMPPLENNAEKNRAYFHQLKELGQQFNLTEFSMGSSQDYQVALEEGATWIRLGTILFGERQKKNLNV